MTVRNRCATVLASLVLTIIAAVPAPAEDLFTASVFFSTGKFTSGIEGPAVDSLGNVYAVCYTATNKIGRVTPGTTVVDSPFVTLTSGVTPNGMRFGPDGALYAADYTNHKILRIDPATRAAAVYASSSILYQPNDLAVCANGVIFITDPKYGTPKAGRIWRVATDGTFTLVDSTGLQITNGIDVSPGDSILYMNESARRYIWKYPLDPATGMVTGSRTLFADMNTLVSDASGLDGMRCDSAGNLYVPYNTAGKVAIISPAGTLLRTVKLSGSYPTNVAFGGSDGCTCYITVKNPSGGTGWIETFRTDIPGREWQMWHRNDSGVADEPAPAAFSITGNHPNPFNPSTTIEFSLAIPGDAALTVYDSTGRTVRHLAAGRLAAGAHSAVWDGRDSRGAAVSSGVYIARLTMNGATASRRMLLVK